MQINLFIITSTITLLFSFFFTAVYLLPPAIGCLPPCSHCSLSACYIFTDLHLHIHLCIFPLLSLSDFLSSSSQLTLSCSFADTSCWDLCCHYVCIIGYFTSLTLNSASALSCCCCALTWFKFKLACMSLANQMFCMITYGWALSEIKGSSPFCMPLTTVCSPFCFYTQLRI